MPTRRKLLGVSTILLLLGQYCLFAETQSLHWNQFRGPKGAGVGIGCRPPLELAADRTLWKVSVPPGKSSPVLWDDRVFLTSVEGDRLVTLCVDAGTGRVLWKRAAPEVSLPRVHPANSAASSTPCADENHLYVYFGAYGLLCYDHDGVEKWRKPLPCPKSMYGVATSPIAYGDRVFLALDDDANLPDSRLSRSKVIALGNVTGETVWETPRPYNRGGWSSPMIWTHEGGRDLVVLGNGRVYGYAPDTGEEKWYVTGFAREPIAVPVAGDGRLYVSMSMQGGRGDVELDPTPFWTAMLHFDRNGDGQIARDEITEHFTLPFRPELPPDHPGFGLPLPSEPAQRKKRQNDVFNWRDANKDGFWTREEFSTDMKVGRGRPCLAAIRPGGRGDVTDSHVEWRLRKGIPEIPSPVFHRGRLYLARAGGTLGCVNADTGEVVYRERLGASGQYSASPVIANGHLYIFSEKGVATVVACGDTFSIAHRSELGRSIAATPAVDRKTLYVRTEDNLIAFR
jgi:outer membrane protein assembly factor BamB